jgi:putative transcriptional regulator
MRWRIVDLEITPEDRVLAAVANFQFSVTFLAHVYLDGRMAYLSGLHLQGNGANTIAPAADLARMHIRACRRRPADATVIAQVRGRHGLSQREFADWLGLDIDTLQNWEQGRNKPDPAALSLVRIFDQSPDLVLDAVFEPIGP